MTRTQIRSEVKDRTDDDEISNTAIDNWITFVDNDIIKKNNGKWTFQEDEAPFNTVIGDGSYSLSSVAANIKERGTLRDEDGELTELSYHQFYAKHSDYPDADETGIPHEYTIYEDTILLYPIPSEVRTITLPYKKDMSDWSGDNDTPFIPKEHQEIYILGCKWRYKVKEEGESDNDTLIAKKDYEDALSLLVVDDKPNRTINVLRK
jgi:hypothetical protein